MERKARWVEYIHKTPHPECSTFADVVSLESIIIALTYTALNYLPVFGAGIQNAYLKALLSEKHYIICGPKFGLDNYGKIAIIVLALYDENYSDAEYWRHVQATMDGMYFESCKVGPR